MAWEQHLLNHRDAVRIKNQCSAQPLRMLIFQKQKMNAQSALKGTVDYEYWMADDIGVEGVQKLKSVLNGLRSWCCMKCIENKKEREENFSGDNLMRKIVSMTSSQHTRNVKRVINTCHM